LLGGRLGSKQYRRVEEQGITALMNGPGCENSEPALGKGETA